MDVRGCVEVWVCVGGPTSANYQSIKTCMSLKKDNFPISQEDQRKIQWFMTKIREIHRFLHDKSGRSYKNQGDWHVCVSKCSSTINHSSYIDGLSLSTIWAVDLDLTLILQQQYFVVLVLFLIIRFLKHGNIVEIYKKKQFWPKITFHSENRFWIEGALNYQLI
jgi:hypothetical protein